MAPKGKSYVLKITSEDYPGLLKEIINTCEEYKCELTKYSDRVVDKHFFFYTVFKSNKAAERINDLKYALKKITEGTFKNVQLYLKEEKDIIFLAGPDTQLLNSCIFACKNNIPMAKPKVAIFRNKKIGSYDHKDLAKEMGIAADCIELKKDNIEDILIAKIKRHYKENCIIIDTGFSHEIPNIISTSNFYKIITLNGNRSREETEKRRRARNIFDKGKLHTRSTAHFLHSRIYGKGTDIAEVIRRVPVEIKNYEELMEIHDHIDADALIQAINLLSNDNYIVYGNRTVFL